VGSRIFRRGGGGRWLTGGGGRAGGRFGSTKSGFKNVSGSGIGWLAG
jgi:hypothetical protein